MGSTWTVGKLREGLQFFDADLPIYYDDGESVLSEIDIVDIEELTHKLTGKTRQVLLLRTDLSDEGLGLTYEDYDRPEQLEV